MGFGTSLVKYLLFFFNLLFVLLGLIIIILGVLAHVSMKDAMTFETDGFLLINTSVIAIIVIGVVLFVISFFGCCGAIKEDVCMLNTYGIILLIIFTTQAALGIYVYLKIQNNKDYLVKQLDDLVVEYLQGYDKKEDVTEFVNEIQQKWNCCGAKGPMDYAQLYPGYNLPQSCCSENKTSCTTSSPNVYSEGCIKVLMDKLIPYVKTAGIVAISIAAIELIGGIFGVCLGCSIKNNRKYYT